MITVPHFYPCSIYKLDILFGKRVVNKYCGEGWFEIFCDGLGFLKYFIQPLFQPALPTP